MPLPLIPLAGIAGVALLAGKQHPAAAAVPPPADPQPTVNNITVVEKPSDVSGSSLSTGAGLAAAAAAGAIVGGLLDNIYDGSASGKENTTTKTLAPIVGGAVGVAAYVVGGALAATGLTAAAIVVTPALVIISAFLSFSNEFEAAARDGVWDADSKQVKALIDAGDYQGAWAKNIELFNLHADVYKALGHMPWAWKGGSLKTVPVQDPPGGPVRDVPVEAYLLNVHITQGKEAGDKAGADLEAAWPFLMNHTYYPRWLQHDASGKPYLTPVDPTRDTQAEARARDAATAAAAAAEAGQPSATHAPPVARVSSTQTIGKVLTRVSGSGARV